MRHCYYRQTQSEKTQENRKKWVGALGFNQGISITVNTPII